MAWRNHSNRLADFALKLEETQSREIKEIVDEARLTAIEFDLVQGCMKSLCDPVSAKVDLNRAIEMMGRPNLQILSTDVHVGLWGFVARVLKNGSPL